MADTASRGRRIHSFNASARFSPTVIDPNSAPDWNMTLYAGRPTSRVGAPTPSIRTVPAIGSSSPVR